MTIDYGERIPNNVDLAADRRLQRALEAWQPRFLEWWRETGPELPTRDVYLRTAVSVSGDGWAHYGHVPLADYRWGIFLAERDPGRTVGFGRHRGEPAWQQVPGEYRSELRRLGATAPSLYDLRNLFQVNVEEGRHLWAMVYLLHAHFGRDGREEAEALLERRSGDADRPRILGAFNEPTPDWLAFFMFTYFTDRDGKFQLGTLKESAFDPLSRTCAFMLKEESHHMFVGTTGLDRVVERTARLMVEHDTDDIREHGGIPLDVIQRYLNLHFSVSLDLFGGETSSNVAAYYTAGLKGRWAEDLRDDDHRLLDATLRVDALADGHPDTVEVPALTGLNQDLRARYTADCEHGVARWNRLLAETGVDARLRLPHRAFNRHVGVYAGHRIDPDGVVVDEDTWRRSAGRWLPTEVDRSHVVALMQPVHEPGRMASWIAPPRSGIDGRPLDYEYVHLA